MRTFEAELNACMGALVRQSEAAAEQKHVAEMHLEACRARSSADRAVEETQRALRDAMRLAVATQEKT